MFTQKQWGGEWHMFTQKQWGEVVYLLHMFTQKQWGEVVYLLKDSNNNEHFAQSTLCWDFQCLFSVNLQLSILIPSLLLLDIYLRETIKTTNNDITERFFPME